MKNLKMSVKLSMILVLVFIMVMGSGFSAIKGMKTISSHADDALEEEVRNQYDESIRQQVDNAISMLDQYYAAYEAGECTLEEAKKQGADMLRELRYGDSGYFWQMIRKGITLYCSAVIRKVRTVWEPRMAMAMRW